MLSLSTLRPDECLEFQLAEINIEGRLMDRVKLLAAMQMELSVLGGVAFPRYGTLRPDECLEFQLAEINVEGRLMDRVKLFAAMQMELRVLCNSVGVIAIGG